MYLVQGFFFQGLPGFGIAYEEGDARVFVHTTLLRTMFSGMFGPSEKGSTSLVGKMADHYGEADIDIVTYEKDIFRFMKKYTHRNDLIAYEFERNPNGFWYGTYSGSATGEGKACCVTTFIPDDFLLPGD